MKKTILILILSLSFSACTLNYDKKDIRKSVNENLPYDVDVKIGTLEIVKLLDVEFNEKEHRVHFSFKVVADIFSKKECSSFKLSAKPILVENQIKLIDVKADKIKCGIDVTAFANIVYSFFEDDIEVVKLKGIKKMLVKDMKLTNKGIDVKIGFLKI